MKPAWLCPMMIGCGPCALLVTGAAFVRPRRLSMEGDSELQRTLAKELMGMSRAAADKPVGEEEAEREVRREKLAAARSRKSVVLL